MKIEFGKPLIDTKELKEVEKTLSQPTLVHGKKTEIFEEMFKNFVKSKYAITVSSCTAGLHLAYKALGICSGDEVIVTAQSHVATAHAIEFVGAKPVFVDCELDFGNIDINLIESKITKKTKAISVVHFLGMPVDMIKLKKLADKHNLKIIEDCALAVGSKINSKHVGNFGDVGCFSFYPVKHMTTIEGGMVITNNKQLAKYIKKARAFGYEKNLNLLKQNKLYDVDVLGLNYRMNEVQSTIGICQLSKIKSFLEIRAENNFNLRKNLSSVEDFFLLKDSFKNFTHSNYCVSLILGPNLKYKRKIIIEKLKKKGIGTSIYYPGPIPDFSFYKEKYNTNAKNFPKAKCISSFSLALSVGPHLRKKHMNFISKNLKEIIKDEVKE